MASFAKVIRIDKTPHGEAPEWVRQAWVGCQLPTAYAECGHIPVYVSGVLAKQRKGLMSAEEFLDAAAAQDQKIAGYSVPQDLALQVLEVHSPEAAQWFYDHDFPTEDMLFRFKTEEVEVTHVYVRDEMEYRHVRLYDDMERGTIMKVA